MILDEMDLTLVDALQINPRASWTRLGEVLDIAPITLARRWKRLVDDGAAWIAVAHSNASARGAVIEFACRPGTERAVADALAAVPYVTTVGIMTGEFQVYANIVAATVDATSRILLSGIQAPDGVIRTRSHVFGSLYGGMVWRLGIVNAAAAAQLRPTTPDPAPEAPPLAPTDQRLFVALSIDGRRSFTDLAAELGSTPRAVQRQLARLERRGDIVFRCDVARDLAGRHATAFLWLEIPDAEVRGVGTRLGTWPEVRMCAAVVSTTNLALIVDLRSFEHLEELLVRIASTFPSARVVERRLVLRHVKIYGRLVGDAGRAVGVMPPDPWLMDTRAVTTN